MKLILMRHGPAESITSVRRDADRKLTPAGRDKTKVACQGLERLLRPSMTSERLIVWHSPLKRSQETAQILTSCIESELLEKDFIAHGSFADFHREAQLALKNQSSCLLIVGHQPSLELWSQRLCACPLPFRKCAAAAFQWIENRSAWQLAWFVQPATLRGLANV